MKNKLTLIAVLFLLITSLACNSGQESASDSKLPYYGRKQISGTDTTYHTIADYKFMDQDSNFITPDTFKDKIYVSDFFFTSCPDICPIMKTQMLRVYEKFENNPNVMLLSHTIDPVYDTIPLLKDYADKLGVKTDKWRFVTGDKAEIYKLGQTSYMVTTVEDASEPSGIIHSGAFILVDKERRVRGSYDGTKAEKVDLLLKDIDKLLAEYGQ